MRALGLIWVSRVYPLLGLSSCRSGSGQPSGRLWPSCDSSLDQAPGARSPTSGPGLVAWRCLGANPPPLDRNEGSSPRSASSAPDAPRQVEHFNSRAEPQQKLRRQQRYVMARDAIDLDEIATPELLDPCQGPHSGLCSWNVLRTITGLVNGDHASFTLRPLLPDHRGERVWY